MRGPAPFHGVVPRTHVRQTVRDAARDLEGQIVAEALGEMLYRLAHYRLSRDTHVHTCPGGRVVVDFRAATMSADRQARPHRPVRRW
ncbi:hypothetical protein CF166_00600 [Amycolatopsis sp. KNN50.9b]|nr:hypothetical protein CF166_00600 [Amycolatopsis sp. KNN50.9b]